MNNSTVKLYPSSLNGTINIISSKSMTHRVIIASSLANEPSVLKNIDLSNDILATIEAVKAYGTKVTIKNKTVTINPNKKKNLKRKLIDCNESGSTLRFFIPIMAMFSKKVTFTGAKSLLSRPMSIYQDVFEKSNSEFIHNSKIITVKGPIKAGEYTLDGSVSSQFFTGLMFVLPMLENDSVIKVKGNLESKSYIDLTLQVLNQFGVSIIENNNTYYIRGNQTYKGKKMSVEGDYSQAAFMLVGGAINGHVKLNNLSNDSVQGDKVIIEHIERMKGKIIRLEDGISSLKSKTEGTVIDLADCPDLGPILALLGSLSTGSTKLINAERLKIKESDRIESTVTTLQKLGASISATDSEILIEGKKYLSGGVTLDSFNDHRIAMMVSIAALQCKNPVVLTNATAVNKSYPNFFEDYQQLGGIIEIME